MENATGKEKIMHRNLRRYVLLVACLALCAAAFAAVALAQSGGSDVKSTSASGSGADTKPGTTLVLPDGQRVQGDGRPPAGAETHASDSGVATEGYSPH
ncbi:MAG: hypothetical protein JSU06_10575 [Actinobacteria bacterium]|nr:hypothetical protein [Actinomycetota bacterium]